MALLNLTVLKKFWLVGIFKSKPLSNSTVEWVDGSVDREPAQS